MPGVTLESLLGGRFEVLHPSAAHVVYPFLKTDLAHYFPKNCTKSNIKPEDVPLEKGMSSTNQELFGCILGSISIVLS